MSKPGRTNVNVTDLPEEILIIILHYLDIKSIHNLYYSSDHMKYILSTKGVVKACHMSLNTLATVKLFKTDFFKAISPHLLELNLCAVPDLRKSYVIPAMRRMKKLLTLDISFSNLSMLDFLEIFAVCPTITSVSLNFMINKSGISKFSDDSILQFQEVFRNFRHVHFIGSATNLLYSKLPFLLLQEANLDCLEYTIAESDRLHTIYVPERAERTHMVNFKQFFLFFLDWTTSYAFFGSFFMLPVLSMLDLNTIEAIIIIKKHFKKFTIFTTPTFQTYFQENFDVDADKIYIAEYEHGIKGNAAVMIWNKASYEFDDSFFTKLTKLLKPFFPCDCDLYEGASVPEKYDWFFITPTLDDSNVVHPPPPYGLKRKRRRKRVAPPPIVLNYDGLFRTKQRIQLSLISREFIRNPVSLPIHCNYLQKLTFLSITGSVRLSAEFFTVLFQNSVNLVTVNIESPPVFPCTRAVSRAIHLSPGLKNLRLTDNMMDFKLLFSSLAECKTLENIHVLELTTGESVDIGNPAIVIEKCPNLYNLFIQAPMSESRQRRKTQTLNRAKTKLKKPHINVVLHVRTDNTNRTFYSYDPFVSVYNLNPIKHIMI